MTIAEPRPFEFRSPHGICRVEHTSRCWNGITVRHVVQQLNPGKVWHDLSSNETTVAIVLDQSGGYCEPRLNLRRPTPRDRFDAGHAVFVPAGMTIWGYSDDIQMTRDLRLSFDVGRLPEILGEELDTAKVDIPVLMLYDDRVVRCANLLAEECQPMAHGNRLYGESLTMALMAALFSRCKNDQKAHRGLSPWQLRLAVEYFEHHITQDLSLDDAAHRVGLSQSQFARLFKVSTGLPPYRWCLNARIKRAQALLLRGELTIVDIAAETGFADQSHFTNVFRRITGLSPKQWQKEQMY
jgi:AraC family transcriptional regulator